MSLATFGALGRMTQSQEVGNAASHPNGTYSYASSRSRRALGGFDPFQVPVTHKD